MFDCEDRIWLGTVRSKVRCAGCDQKSTRLMIGGGRWGSTAEIGRQNASRHKYLSFACWRARCLGTAAGWLSKLRRKIVVGGRVFRPHRALFDAIFTVLRDAMKPPKYGEQNDR